MKQIISGGYIGVLLLIFCFCIFNAGMAVGLSRNASHCDDFGRFRYGDVIYECKRSEVNK